MLHKLRCWLGADGRCRERGLECPEHSSAQATARSQATAAEGAHVLPAHEEVVAHGEAERRRLAVEDGHLRAERREGHWGDDVGARRGDEVG